MIQVRDVVARYGHFSLKKVSLFISAGECFALIGPSGAGKTLLLETIMGVKPPAHGRILVEDTDITTAPPEQRRFSYVPQDLALFPHLSVPENIGFGLRIRNTPSAEIERRIRVVAGMLRIESLLNRRDVRSLSGGEKQRVALARALAVEPRVLFLDEPFGALDTSMRRQLHVEMRDVQRRLRLTTVLVTHDLDEAFALADRIGIMIDGGIQQVGHPRFVYENPTNLHVARFLLVENILRGQCVGDGPAEGERLFRVGDLIIAAAYGEPIAPDQACWLGIRAQDVEITPEVAGSPGSCTEEEKPAVIEAVRRHACTCTVLMRSLSDQVRLEGLLPSRQEATMRLEPGQHVRIRIPPRRVLIFPGEDAASVAAGSPG